MVRRSGWLRVMSLLTQVMLSLAFALRTRTRPLAATLCSIQVVRYVDTYSGYAFFGLRFADTNTSGYNVFESDGYTDGNRYALRPVVSLPSSLLTGEKTNGAWNLSK